MSFKLQHIDMLECDISGQSDRTYLHISWDTIKKQYALGVRVYNGRAVPSIETIYFDFETTSHVYQRLPEVLSLLNKFNNHEIKPVQNYVAAYRLSQMALHSQNRKNWGACDFELLDL